MKRLSFLILLLSFTACEMDFNLSNDDSELFVAAEEGDLDTVERLPARGVDLDALDEYGRTALIVAAEYGHIDIVGFLLNKRVEVNIKDDDGWTALSIAKKQGNMEIAQMLENRGAIE